MAQGSVAILYLPDGRMVFQRRSKDAPLSPGLLGFFGGHVEKGETPEQAMRRELSEELALEFDELGMEFMASIELGPEQSDHPGGSVYHVFKGKVESLDMDVYEGDGAEAYTLGQVQKRDDLALPCRYLLKQLT